MAWQKEAEHNQGRREEERPFQVTSSNQAALPSGTRSHTSDPLHLLKASPMSARGFAGTSIYKHDISVMPPQPT